MLPSMSSPSFDGIGDDHRPQMHAQAPAAGRPGAANELREGIMNLLGMMVDRSEVERLHKGKAG
jgi:hypothetical protein